MKSALLTAALLVTFAVTASAKTEPNDPTIPLVRSTSALPNDCVNRMLVMDCPLTDAGKNDRHSGTLGTIK